MTPQFRFGKFTEAMLQRGVNPFIHTNTADRFYDKYRPSFNGLEEYAVTKYTPNVYYTLEDFECDNNCDEECGFNLEKYKINEGQLMIQSDETHLGHGGFGNVFKGKWHSAQAAYKFVKMEDLEYIGELNEISEHTKTTVEEFLKQKKLRIIITSHTPTQ